MPQVSSVCAEGAIREQHFDRGCPIHAHRAYAGSNLRTQRLTLSPNHPHPPRTLLHPLGRISIPTSCPRHFRNLVATQGAGIAPRSTTAVSAAGANIPQ